VGKLLQNLFGKDPRAADFNSPVHQVEENVFSFLADRSQMFKFHYQFAAAEISLSLFTRPTQLGCPRDNQAALHDNPVSFLSLGTRDLQHGL
jgi:hypothetical protein